MKLNIFAIPQENVEALVSKLQSVGMSSVFQAEVESWMAEFFFSTEPEPLSIPWATDFAEELASLGRIPANTAHYGAYIWRKGSDCYVLSFGKTHFYLREFCDSDFGLSMAKRIGDKEDVRQKAARRYAGLSRKEIRSYRKESLLDIESGESVDYLQAATIDEESWGKAAKFGASLLLTPDIEKAELPALFEEVTAALQAPERFALPRTEVIKDEQLIAEYDEQLIEAILNENVDFDEAGHQLVGVDFVFTGSEKFSFQWHRSHSPSLDSPSVASLCDFIRDFGISRDKILDVNVRVSREDSKAYSQKLRKSIEYSIENEKVFLRRGEWVRFNEDYANFLDDYVDRFIEIDNTLESDLREISLDEPSFNKSLLKRGYEVADTDFSIIALSNYSIEAWDLKKDDTAYAVKFGSAQKLGYVCDQASNILDIYRTEPAVFKNIDLKTYCLWLGFARAAAPARLSDVNSIIFKQKLEAWARKCRNMNVKPMVRISRKVVR